jgi:glucose/arabinose dehydrogenase
LKLALFLLPLLFSFSLSFAEEPSEGWKRLSDMPEVRSEMEAVAIGDKIYVAGGLNNSREGTNTVFIYNIKEDNWELGTSMQLSLHHAGATSFNEKLYVVGGYLDSWKPSSSLLIYDSKLDTWTVGPDMPTARGALTAQFLGGKLYAVGGFSGTTLSVNEVFDPKTNNWETKSKMPTNREHLTSAVLDDQLYVIGGRERALNLNLTERYESQTDSWETLEPLPTARSGLTASVLSGAIFVFGGESTLKTFDENEAYVPEEGWFSQQPMPISRHGLASTTVGSNIYVIGGGAVSGFSYSGITETYHNTVISEFGTETFENVESQEMVNYEVEAIAENLQIPWDIAYTPDGRILFTERVGNLRVIENGELNPEPVKNFELEAGGLLGLALDPKFEENHYLYLFYSYTNSSYGPNKVTRFVESDNKLSDETTLLDGIPGVFGWYGGRLAFGPDEKLYITTGDHTEKGFAQDLDSLAGKILRINSDGTIPEDNPFEDSPIYSYGHRNPHGLDWEPVSGKLVVSEHGPTEKIFGHDEINIIEPGGNYGWPNIVGNGVDPKYKNPIFHTGNSTWAPEGSVFYNSDKFPELEGKFLVTTLRGEHLRVLDLDIENNKIISNDFIFLGEFGRLRDVSVDPEGYLILLTSNQDGRGDPKANDDRILRILPKPDRDITQSHQKLFPPLKQVKMGIDPKEVQCKNQLELILKFSNGLPACVKDTTALKLINSGWQNR